MPKFDLKTIEAVKGREKFYQLTIDDEIEITGTESSEELNKKKKGVLDKFESQIEKNYKKDINSLYAYMNLVASGVNVPPTKFKDITPANEKVKEYEFKKGDLRIYAIKTESGKIIILCGYKNNQPKDIKRFRSLKKQFLESKK